MAMSDYTRDWTHRKWPEIPDRARQAVFDAVDEREIGWWPNGSGLELRFERLIDYRGGGEWPFDLEIVECHFDRLHRLKAVERSKVIRIERGRSYADLHRMLRMDGAL